MERFYLKILLTSLLYIFSTCATSNASEPVDLNELPIVTTDLGKIRGNFLTSRRGQRFLAFRGIRYAKAPIDELRFQPPAPIEPWSDVFNATEDGPKCIQESEDKSDLSEDCLRINVYTHSLTPSKLKPVILYLHPGGFYGLSGQSKNFAGPQYLMDRDIVFVAINYRLGILGFLSTGTKEAPGNNGLKDQVIALRWIRDHISKFGGDPNSVTLMGYSAGAMSISMHLVSPMSRGLFHKAIVMSASVTMQWEISNDQLDLAKRQARLLNCLDDSIESIMNCLKSASAINFIDTLPNMFEFERNPVLLFRPVVELDFGQERFMVDNPTKLFAEGNFLRVPIVAGITEYEFLYPAIEIMENETLYNRMSSNFNKWAPICFLYERDTENSNRISNELRSAFLNGTESNLLTLTGLNHLFADGLIGFGMHRLVDLASRYTTVFYYQFSFTGRYSHTYYPKDQPFGAVHHDDLIYLLSSKLYFTEAKNEAENRTIERMTRLWTEFASKGDPNNPDDEYLKGVQWRPMVPHQFNYLNINQSISMKNQLFTERYNVWNRLFPIDKLNRYNRTEDLDELLCKDGGDCEENQTQCNK